jgi:D-lactate dehydrogenase
VEGAARGGGAVGRGGVGVPVRRRSGTLRRAVSHELLPAFGHAMPAPASQPLPAGVPRAQAAAVYMPACVNRIFGNARDQRERPSVIEAMLAVSQRAGLPLWIPDDVAGTCCGTPWSSKGFGAGHEHAARAAAGSILRWTENGRLPLVIDATSCAHGLLHEVPDALDEAERERFAAVRVIDSIEWVHDSLLAALEIERPLERVALHPPCAARSLGLDGKLEAVVSALGREVITPVERACCGTAGDRGMLHPELPAAAIAPTARELARERPDACVCSNRTCEIGLSEVTGRRYRSFVQVLDDLTRPA